MGIHSPPMTMVLLGTPAQHCLGNKHSQTPWHLKRARVSKITRPTLTLTARPRL